MTHTILYRVITRRIAANIESRAAMDLIKVQAATPHDALSRAVIDQFASTDNAIIGKTSAEVSIMRGSVEIIHKFNIVENKQ